LRSDCPLLLSIHSRRILRLILKLGVHLGQLSACIRNFLKALYDRLMALQRRLNGLSGSMFTLSQLFQLSRIRLLLMKQLLIHVGGLIRLHDKLLNQLLAVVHLLGNAVVLKLIVHWYTSWIVLAIFTRPQYYGPAIDKLCMLFSAELIHPFCSNTRPLLSSKSNTRSSNIFFHLLRPARSNDSARNIGKPQSPCDCKLGKS
jgi:hypothetical protein